MSESIQEIHLDIPEEIANNTEIITNDAAPVADITELEATPMREESAPPMIEEANKENIKPKAKGRPKGAPNKGPSKPRAKKTQVNETPVIEAEEPAAILGYEPSSPKRNLRIQPPTSSEVAAAMLKLLQDQTYSRQSRRQRLHDSWFQ